MKSQYKGQIAKMTRVRDTVDLDVVLKGRITVFDATVSTLLKRAKEHVGAEDIVLADLSGTSSYMTISLKDTVADDLKIGQKIVVTMSTEEPDIEDIAKQRNL